MIVPTGFSLFLMGYQDVLDKLKKVFSRNLTVFMVSLVPFSSRCHEALNIAYDWMVVAQVFWDLLSYGQGLSCSG